MSLSTALIPTFWLALAAAQPAPVPVGTPPPRPAAPLAGKCMWEQIPPTARAAILSKPTLAEAYEEMGARMQVWGEEGVTAAGKACAVESDQFNSAGRRMAGWLGREWSERQLTGRVTAQRLDEVYSAYSASEKADMKRAFDTRASKSNPHVMRFFQTLGFQPSDTQAYSAAVSYLIARISEDADIVAGR